MIGLLDINFLVALTWPSHYIRQGNSLFTSKE